jgi:twitching motility protein PilT
MALDLPSLLEIARPLAVSDLFLSEGRPPYVRKNSVLEDLNEPAVARPTIEDLFRLCGRDPASTLDGDVAYTTEDGMRFRVNLHHHGNGKLGAVLRHVRRQIPTMDVLGLPEEVVAPWLQRAAGLVLVAGGTGSGKSTTVASCLAWINSQRCAHIVTVEDPVEYIFGDNLSVFTQREIGHDTASFSDGMRGAMRQSPNVIFLGEVRDAETAQAALHASQSGQLVITTVQAYGIRDAVGRYAGFFSESARKNALDTLAGQLVGVLAQRLLPGANGGLFLATEHFENGGAIRGWIRDDTPERIAELVREHPTPQNRGFLESLVSGARAGLISPETGFAASENPAEFKRAFRGVA